MSPDPFFMKGWGLNLGLYHQDSFSHQREGLDSGLCHQTPFLLESGSRVVLGWEGGRVGSGFRVSPDPFPHERVGGWESGRVGSRSRVVSPDPFPFERVGSGSTVMSPDAFPFERVGLGTRLQARLVCNQPTSHHIPAETPLQS